MAVSGSQPRTHLEELGVGLAATLKEEGARRWLIQALQGSRYVENRIPFRRILATDSSAYIQKVLQRSGRAFSAGEIAILPELELYVPIKAQYAAINTSSSLQVAVRAAGDSFYIVRPDGSAFRVGEWYDPGSQLTVVLGRSEIDYEDPATALKGGSATGEGILAAMRRLGVTPDQMLGTDILPGSTMPHVECTIEIENCSGAGGTQPTGGSTAQNTQLYWVSLEQHMEGLLMGDNEIEVWGSVNGFWGACGSLTNLWWGEAYGLFTSANLVFKVANAIPTGASRFKLSAYEDDNDRCVRNGDDDYLGSWMSGITIGNYGRRYFTDPPSIAYISVIARSW